MWWCRSLFSCALVLGACIAPLEEAPPSDRTPLAGDSALVDIFVEVGAETGVPAELLAALAQVETRLRIVTPDTHHTHGVPRLGLFGMSPAELDRGASLAGVSTEAAASDPAASTRAAAALLRAQAPTATTTAQFLAVLEPSLRRSLEVVLARGVDARDIEGGTVLIAAQRMATPKRGTVTQALSDYESAEWIPAHPENYSNSDRGVGDISHVVVHTTQGAYNGTISWFKNPDASVSAHYVIRSMDGHIAQMVDEADVAWHDKCFNTTTIGLEHEGFVEDPGLWYTEEMYAASAKLSAYLADKYGIEKTHEFILGHGDAPDCSTHTDPGPGWDWDKYLDLVRTGGAPQFDASDVLVLAPDTMVAGERETVIVQVTNRGNTTWSVDATRLGTALPQDRASELFVDGDWISPSRVAGVETAVAPGETGFFSFDIVAPMVTETTAFDEAFQLTEEGVAWFGPEVHVVTTVEPSPDMNVDDGGCSAGGSGSGSAAGVILALGALVSRRRARRL